MRSINLRVWSHEASVMSLLALFTLNRTTLHTRHGILTCIQNNYMCRVEPNIFENWCVTKIFFVEAKKYFMFVVKYSIHAMTYLSRTDWHNTSWCVSIMACILSICGKYNALSFIFLTMMSMSKSVGKQSGRPQKIRNSGFLVCQVIIKIFENKKKPQHSRQV